MRPVLLSLLCAATVASEPNQPRPHAPYVSCFSNEGHFRGSKTVRTPEVTSADRRSRAYATICAEALPRAKLPEYRPPLRRNQPHAAFHQVLVQKPSVEEGTGSSLGPVAWSPDGRWLLVEGTNSQYSSDAYSMIPLLYDRQTGSVSTPDLDRLVQRTLRKACSLTVRSVLGFSTSSHVLLSLADTVDVGDLEPQTHCLHGAETWALDPLRSTAHPQATAGPPDPDRCRGDPAPMPPINPAPSQPPPQAPPRKPSSWSAAKDPCITQPQASAVILT